MRRSSRPKRRKAPAHSGNSILVVTEGEKTEPNYFRMLLKRLGLMASQVRVVHPECTDPVGLVNFAVGEMKSQRKASKNGFEVPFDEAWVVFDMERIHSDRRTGVSSARDLAEKHGIRLAHSDPCFEFWLLLHYQKTTKMLDGHDQVARELRKHWPELGKAATGLDHFAELIPTAVTNAEFCRAHHLESEGDGNPSTDVDLLARSMNDATREHLRLPISEA